MSLLKFISIAVITAFSLIACSHPQTTAHFQLSTFDSTLSIELLSATPADLAKIKQRLSQDLPQLEHNWLPNTEGALTRVNQAIKQKQRIAAPPSILPLIKQAQQLAIKSDNLFNPANGELHQLWGFHQSPIAPHEPPKPDTIKKRLTQKPNIDQLKIDGFHLQSSNPAVQLDFHGIALGRALDHTANQLLEFGISNALLKINNNHIALGKRGENAWPVPIPEPRGGSVLGLIKAQQREAVFTLTASEKDFAWDSKFYHHVLDPRTGMPSRQTASVTVIHPEAAAAQAASYALFVAGPKDWQRIAHKMGLKYVLLVDRYGEIHMNPAMADRIQLKTQPPKIHLSENL